MNDRDYARWGWLPAWLRALLALRRRIFARWLAFDRFTPPDPDEIQRLVDEANDTPEGNLHTPLTVEERRSMWVEDWYPSPLFHDEDEQEGHEDDKA